MNFLRPRRTMVRLSGIDATEGRALARALLFGEMLVLSRALTHFEKVRRPSGPRNLKSGEAVRLAAQARSPFDDAVVFALWGEDHVATWSWSARKLVSLGVPLDAWQVPEEALQVANNHQCLMRCADGWALQQRDAVGVIVSSRWWPQRPDEEQLAHAIRGMGCEAETEVLVVDAPNLAAWPPIHWRSSAARFIRSPSRGAIAALAAIAMLPLVYMTASTGALALAEERLSRKVADLESEGREFFEARAELAALSQRSATYDELFFRGHPVPALADLLEVAEQYGLSIDRLRVEQSVLSFDATAEELDPAMLVGDLEAQSELRGVSIERGRAASAWSIEARISGSTSE